MVKLMVKHGPRSARTARTAKGWGGGELMPTVRRIYEVTQVMVRTRTRQVMGHSERPCPPPSSPPSSRREGAARRSRYADHSADGMRGPLTIPISQISVLGERVVDAQRALDSATDKSREDAATFAAHV